jgi:hypothetical protein
MEKKFLELSVLSEQNAKDISELRSLVSNMKLGLLESMLRDVCGRFNDTTIKDSVLKNFDRLSLNKLPIPTFKFRDETSDRQTI